jgi:hypothetical protein
MQISKELEQYILDIIGKGVKSTNGEDTAGYANAILMATRAWGMHIAVEQAQAVNFTSPLREGPDGTGNETTQN